VEQKGNKKVPVKKVQQEETSEEDNDGGNEAEVVAQALVTASQEGPFSPSKSKGTPSRRHSRAPAQNGHAKVLCYYIYVALL
jgi:hypothetical protein